MILHELPTIQQSSQPQPQCVVVEGTRLKVTFFQFQITLPTIEAAETIELSDNELLSVAARGGSFDLLDSPEEDIYNDLAKKSE